jgi:hypothetical protein
MKHIELITLPDPRYQPGDQLYDINLVNYRTIIEQAVRLPLDRAAGASIDEMRKGIRILDALESSNGTLELEDADWDYLRLKVDRMPWAQTDRRFVQFYDDVMGAH